MIYYNRTDISEGTDPAKVLTERNLWFPTIGFLVMGLNFKIMFAIVALI